MSNITTAEQFSLEVERLHLLSGGKTTYLEIAAELMQDKNIDPEDGASFISPTLKGKIQAESRERHLLKERSNTRKLV